MLTTRFYIVILQVITIVFYEIFQGVPTLSPMRMSLKQLCRWQTKLKGEGSLVEVQLYNIKENVCFNIYFHSFEKYETGFFTTTDL